MKLGIAAELPGQVEIVAKQQVAVGLALEGVRKDTKVLRSVCAVEGAV